MSGESADGPLAAETSEVLETTSKYSDASDLEHAHTAQQPEAVNRPVDKAKQRALAEYLERSVRPELTRCSEQEFLDDYKLFHEVVALALASLNLTGVPPSRPIPRCLSVSSTAGWIWSWWCIT